MSLIIKNKIAQLKKGYPTVSDKYNVQGGVFTGEKLLFGDILKTTGVTGHYDIATATTDKIAGICLATNVKLANRYPGDSNAKVETLNGEAFNLLVRGFVAVAVYDADVVEAQEAYDEAVEAYKQEKSKANKEAMDEALADLNTAKDDAIAKCAELAPVNVVVADDKLAFTADEGTAVAGAYFMGVAEFVDGELLAEINYKM